MNQFEKEFFNQTGIDLSNAPIPFDANTKNREMIIEANRKRLKRINAWKLIDTISKPSKTKMGDMGI